MNENEEEQMHTLGITTSVNTVYHYKQYTYNKLSDAIKYVRIDQNRATRKPISTDTERSSSR